MSAIHDTGLVQAVVQINAPLYDVQTQNNVTEATQNIFCIMGEKIIAVFTGTVVWIKDIPNQITDIFFRILNWLNPRTDLEETIIAVRTEKARLEQLIERTAGDVNQLIDEKAVLIEEKAVLRHENEQLTQALDFRREREDLFSKVSILELQVIHLRAQYAKMDQEKKELEFRLETLRDQRIPFGRPHTPNGTSDRGCSADEQDSPYRLIPLSELLRSGMR